jgi:hypothetical protein
MQMRAAHNNNATAATPDNRNRSDSSARQSVVSA